MTLTRWSPSRDSCTEMLVPFWTCTNAESVCLCVSVHDRSELKERRSSFIYRENTYRDTTALKKRRWQMKGGKVELGAEDGELFLQTSEKASIKRFEVETVESK